MWPRCLRFRGGMTRTVGAAHVTTRVTRTQTGNDPTTFPLVSGWCPRQDSNLRHRLRRAVLYPLSYGGGPVASLAHGPPRTDARVMAHAEIHRDRRIDAGDLAALSGRT